MKKILILLFAISTNIYALEAQRVKDTIIIDGVMNEKDWLLAKWYPLNQLMAGVIPSHEDFNGRFKVMWNAEQLYILAEINDDKLFDSHPNPLDRYWDDDCLEIFIDEDRSGGNHQFNFNAFAYHVALDNQVVDIGPNNKDGSTNFILLNDHVNSQWKRNVKVPYTITWEVAVKVYPNTFSLSQQANNKAVTLTTNKIMGFMLAYCDNDSSDERESFIGSTVITPINGDKNLGYITSDVFDTLILK